MSMYNAEIMKELTFDEIAERRTIRWNQLNSIIAKGELPIDPKIKTLVITLNALGIKTSVSCEGHKDAPPEEENWQTKPYPWIGFRRRWFADFDQFSLNPRKGWLSITDNMSTIMQFYGMERMMKYEKFTTEDVLEGYIEEFYTQRQSAQKLMIKTFNNSAGCVLQNKNSEMHPNNKNQNDHAILYRFQKELVDFGTYLKDLYDTQADIPTTNTLRKICP